MTEKELHKLKRHDLLSLLVAQGQDAAAVRSALDETLRLLADAENLGERLKEKLNDKDEQIERLKEKLNDKDDQLERLKEKLNDKDAQIVELEKRLDDFASGRYLEMDSVESLIDISRRLDLMLHAAQQAADRYMKNVQKDSAKRVNNPKGSTGVK